MVERGIPPQFASSFLSDADLQEFLFAASRMPGSTPGLPSHGFYLAAKQMPPGIAVSQTGISSPTVTPDPAQFGLRNFHVMPTVSHPQPYAATPGVSFTNVSFAPPALQEGPAFAAPLPPDSKPQPAVSMEGPQSLMSAFGGRQQVTGKSKVNICYCVCLCPA